VLVDDGVRLFDGGQIEAPVPLQEQFQVSGILVELPGAWIEAEGAGSRLKPLQQLA
jgi:hypothetical protein